MDFELPLKTDSLDEELFSLKRSDDSKFQSQKAGKAHSRI